MSVSRNRFPASAILCRFVYGLFLGSILISVSYSQSFFEEPKGRYRLVHDSTSIWPDGQGGFNYVRRFVSDVVLAEKGRDVLSRPASPVLDRDDKIQINAYTVLPNGDIYYADSTDIITRPLPEDSRRIFVNFRQPDPGARLHLEWTLSSKKASLSGQRFLGRTIDVDSSVVIITVPETWLFNFAISPAVNVNEERIVQRPSRGPASVSHIWTAIDIPALKIEEFSPPVHRIIPSVYYSLSLDIGWDDPESQSLNWARIAGLYNDELEDFIGESSALDMVADSLQNGGLNERETAEAAFDWVRENFISLYPDISLHRDLDEALERRRGSQAEGAAILYALLRKLGIACAPYLSASHATGEPIPELPALFWFDRLLVSCFRDSDTVWADPFYPVIHLGVLPFDDQHVQVLRLDKADGKFESTPEVDYHDNGRAIHLSLELGENGELRGEATEIYSGAMIPEISSYMISLEEDQRKEPWERKLARSFPAVKIERFVTVPPDSPGETYRVGYTFTTGPIMRPFVRRSYIPMDLLGRWEDLPDLPDEERRFPIELRRPRFEFERITIKITGPFEVEFIPKNFSLNSYIGEIYSVARQDGNALTITRGFGLKKSELPVSSYQSLRHFFDTARAEADKQIIIRRTD
jgi:hypothetical protein